MPGEERDRASIRGKTSSAERYLQLSFNDLQYFVFALVEMRRNPAAGWNQIFEKKEITSRLRTVQFYCDLLAENDAFPSFARRYVRCLGIWIIHKLPKHYGLPKSHSSSE